MRLLAGLLPVYAKIAWWGIVSPRISETEPLVVYQAVILGDEGVLLAVRGDLRGWELPGGNANPGESDEAALLREVREETGLEVAVTGPVGDYVRSGFRPHTARVSACRVLGGTLTPSDETPELRWFAPGDLPDTLFPWYRAPIRDALESVAEPPAAAPAPLVRREHNGAAAVLAGLWIDLRMRLSADRAGSR
jgi:8-oxo-dGTP pyrophosphatase MutT (NUDIX family)